MNNHHGHEYKRSDDPRDLNGLFSLSSSLQLGLTSLSITRIFCNQRPGVVQSLLFFYQTRCHFYNSSF